MMDLPPWLDTILIGCLGLFNAWLLVLSNRSNEDRTQIRTRIDAIEKDHAGFREKVARDYVSRDALRELEERLVNAIERLGDRFDRYFDKAK